ncbi:hypothetical protein [Streptomyces sp. NPDC048340]|uniref:hypothetical protein n=1 Tax=Streptomyces sp. NPDC048340 TaxID=3365537 RepID=UPI00371D1F27
MSTRAVEAAYETSPKRTSAPGHRPAPGPGAGRRILRAVALAATLPYLALKAAWLSGSRIGIPDGSVLLEPGPGLILANSVTLAMDASVIVLVLMFTRPWGLRVPSWLPAVPAFVATGLLTPILTGFPGQLLVRALDLGVDGPAKAAREPFLDPWVFTVVYTGFTIQGLALAGLFVPYARERWGWRWQGAIGRRLPSPTGVVAGAAALSGLAVGAVLFYWAFGGEAGMGADRVAQFSTGVAVVTAVHAVCALAAGAGAVLLARGGESGARWPLAVAWTGSAAAMSWGLWMLVTSIGPQLDGGEGATAATRLAYAGQMITGLLGAVVLTRFLTSRREG